MPPAPRTPLPLALATLALGPVNDVTSGAGLGPRLEDRARLRARHFDRAIETELAAMSEDGFHPGPAVYREWAARVVDAIGPPIAGDRDRQPSGPSPENATVSTASHGPPR